MKTGKLSNGFEYEYDETRLDDMRFIDALATVLDPKTEPFEKIAGTSRLIELMLGREMKEALYEHIGQSYDGRVPRQALEESLRELMGADTAKK